MKRADDHHGAEKKACAENNDEERRDDCHVPELRAHLVRTSDSSLGLEGLQVQMPLVKWGQIAFENLMKKP